MSYNILPYALEILETVDDINEAMITIFDHIGSEFQVDSIVLFKSDDKNEQHVVCRWIAPESKEAYDIMAVKYNHIPTTKFIEWYDEDGMAIVDSKVTHHTEEEDGFHTIMAVRSKYLNGEIAHIVFVNFTQDHFWSNEEKMLIKGLSAIIYSYISKFDLIENQKKTEYLLYYDGVSNLPNLDKYYMDVEQYIQQETDKRYAVVVAMITNFQYINETYGREVGNLILQSLGPEYQAIMPECKYVARVTGAIFALLVEYEELPEIRPIVIESCREFTRRMNGKLRIGNLLFISGFCPIVERNGEGILEAYKHADLARKSIKDNGYTESCLYNEQLRQKDLLKNQVITNMKFALENEEFHVYLQPKIDLQSEHIIGAEALVRWIYPDGSMLYPDNFIPIFEENGLIKRLDFYVLKKVLAYLRMQLQQGVEMIPISVNFSRKHHEEEDFVESIVSLLEAYQVDRQWIEIEITESTFTSDKNLLSKNLELLQEQGLSVSIDDFGSGYSALNILSTIRANVIKIDKVFLQDNSGKNINILKYLIRMIKSLDYQVIVEGVETKEQAEFLSELECDMAQGYYYAKPMPIEEFVQYVTEFKGNLLKV